MSFTISINDQAAFEVQFAGPAGPTGPQGPQGEQGVPGPAGVVAATAPLYYDSPTQTVSISPNPTFDAVYADLGNSGLGGNSVFIGDGISTNYLDMAAGLVIQSGLGITFPDSSLQTTAFTTSLLAPYALIESQVFTGTPSLPTGTIGVTQPTLTSTTQLATTAFVQQELAAGTAVAKNLEVLVRNQSGVTMQAGSIVYISGATGNLPLVTLAQANNDANSAQTMGFVKTAIANNEKGYVIVRGTLENIDTSALTEGVQLYLSPTTPGAWTTTKPVAPQHLVYVGIVVRSHPTLGTIQVAIQNGYELDELHDVLITTPATGQVLTYDGVTGLWKNQAAAGGAVWGGITGTLSSQTDLQSALNLKANLSGATFTGKVNFTPVAGVAGLNVGIGGTSAAATTAGDLWIATGGVNLNYRDGTGAWRICAITTSTNTFSSPQIVDTTATTAALRVTQKGTGNAIEVEDSTTPDATRFVIDANGKVGIGVSPDAIAALKVDTNGIMFGDGTVQATAASGSSYSANNAIADMITAAILYAVDEGMGSVLCDTRVEASSGSGRFPTFLSGLDWSLVTINGETASWSGNGEFSASYSGGPGIPWYVSYNGSQASRPFGNFGSP